MKKTKEIGSKTTVEIFKDSIKVKEYIKKQIKANKPIDDKKLKGFKFVQPL